MRAANLLVLAVCLASNAGAQVPAQTDKQALIQAVLRDDNRLDEALQNLTQQDPADAAPTIKAVLAKEREPFRRVNLLMALWSINSEGARQILRQAMLGEQTLAERATAAEGLPREDPSDPIAHLTDEWNKADLQNPIRPFDTVVELGQYLLRTGHDKAIEAVGKRLAELSSQRRANIVQDVLGLGELDKPTVRCRALEDFLAWELYDEDRNIGESGAFASNMGRGQFHDLTVGDYAAARLAYLWPEKGYQFDYLPSQFGIDTQRVEDINIYRKEHGQAILELPSAPNLKAAPSDLPKLIDTLSSSQDASSVAQAKAAILKIGLPALPAVLDRMKAFGGGTVNHGLFEVASELPRYVVEVRVDGDRGYPGSARTMAKSLVGKPLTPDAFTSLLGNYRSSLPKGWNVTVVAYRDAPLEGIQVSVRFRRDSHGPSICQFSCFVDEGMVGGGVGSLDMAAPLVIVHQPVAKALASSRDDRIFLAAEFNNG